MPSQSPSAKPRSLLEDLASSEDEFDVDLMAAGCRLPRPGPVALSVSELIRLYDLKGDSLGAFVEALIDAGKIDSATVYDLADKAAEGRLRESPSKLIKPIKKPGTKKPPAAKPKK